MQKSVAKASHPICFCNKRRKNGGDGIHSHDFKTRKTILPSFNYPNIFHYVSPLPPFGFASY